MKKVIVLCILVSISITFTTPAYCGGPFRKLGRGISNFLTFPLEIPNRIAKTNERSGAYEAATYGIWEGGCMMVLRAAAGVFETLTFPFPIPEHYEPILSDPEFLINFNAKKKS